MSIDINIDFSAVSLRIGAMISRIDHFKRVDIGTGLSDFQTQDMHRNRPFTMRSRGKGTAVTKVRPHSLFEMQRSGKTQRRMVRWLKSKRRRRPPRFYVKTSTRPILRSELFDTLGARMRELLQDKIHW